MSDVVVCLQGLQFFSDATITLRVVRRALSAHSRLAVAVWDRLESSPGHHSLVQALDKYAWAAGAAIVATPFRLGDAQVVRSLVEEARFVNVRLVMEQRIARSPSTDACARGVLRGGTLARTTGLGAEAEQARGLWEGHWQSFQRAMAAGVRIAMGTDIGGYGYGDTALELELLVENGMTAGQAIAAST